MKKAINNFKQQETAVKIGITFVGTFIIPMLIFIVINIASVKYLISKKKQHETTKQHIFKHRAKK